MSGVLPAGFGDGWMSGAARDLLRVLVAFGGFDAAELVAALPTTNRGLIRADQIEEAARRLSR